MPATQKRPRRRNLTGLKQLKNGEILISVKGLHRAIDRLEPLFEEAQRRKPELDVLGEILTLMRDLRIASECQRNMTAVY